MPVHTNSSLGLICISLGINWMHHVVNECFSLRYIVLNNIFYIFRCPLTEVKVMWQLHPAQKAQHLRQKVVHKFKINLHQTGAIAAQLQQGTTTYCLFISTACLIHTVSPPFCTLCMNSSALSLLFMPFDVFCGTGSTEKNNKKNTTYFSEQLTIFNRTKQWEVEAVEERLTFMMLLVLSPCGEAAVYIRQTKSSQGGGEMQIWVMEAIQTNMATTASQKLWEPRPGLYVCVSVLVY